MKPQWYHPRRSSDEVPAPHTIFWTAWNRPIKVILLTVFPNNLTAIIAARSGVWVDTRIVVYPNVVRDFVVSDIVIIIIIVTCDVVLGRFPTEDFRSGE